MSSVNCEKCWANHRRKKGRFTALMKYFRMMFQLFSITEAHASPYQVLTLNLYEYKL